MYKFILTIALISLSTFATEKVVYGTDERVEAYQSPAYNELARSTAILIRKNKLKADLTLSEQTLGQKKNFCPEVRFTDQPAPGECSGFLVSPKLLLTAGHCIRFERECRESYWLFDFMLSENNTVSTNANPSNLYQCSRIISQANNGLKEDFALIELDRAVTDRSPLSVRTEGRIDDNAELVVIGNPLGLPTKVAPGGTVRDNTHDIFFVTNTDSFAGNSGSAVINMETGIVEGILVRGERDFIYNRYRDCMEPNECLDDSCRGEDVSRISSVKKLLNILK